MALDIIASDAVRDVLRALRYANPVQSSPLLDLDLVSARLRTEDLADTPQGRVWALGCCLTDAVDGQLRRLRSGRPGVPAVGLTHEVEIAQLAQDLVSDRTECLDWGLLHWRYLSPTHQPARQVSRSLGLSGRTVRYRVARGLDAFTKVLRQLEVEATRSLEARADASPVDRIIVDEGAATRGVVEMLGELQALVSQHKQTVRITPAQLEALARYPVAELIAYRLGRIAEWSLPRYRLDSRFVELSLLVDLGEESQSGRWQAREERFTDLRDVLKAVGEPAVVLLGPPGSGKSTLLRRLELDLSSDALGPGDIAVAAPLTFFVSLNQYRPETADAPLPAPKTWLTERWAARFPNLPPLADVAAERGVVYLLDGFNEMPHRSAEDYRMRIAQWKQFLLETVTPDSGHRAVIACRSLDYSAPLSTPAQRVPQVQIEPMSDAKVEEFLRRYSPQNAGELWAELAGTKVLDAVRWPFFLRLLVEAAADEAPGGWHADLPALFTSYVRRALVREIERHNPRLEPNGLLDERDYERIVSRRGWRNPYELPERGELFRQLATLAYGMQTAAADAESSQVRIGYADALALLDGSDGAMVIRVGAELGLLDEDRATDEVMFQHQLLQEYFAARALAREPKPELVTTVWRISDIRPGLQEILDALPQSETLPALPTTGWEETTILAAAMSERPEQFLRAVMSHNVVVAGRAAAMAELQPRLPEALLDELRWALVHRSRDAAADLRERIACGYAVGDLGDPRFERREGPHGPYLMLPLVAIPDGVYPIGGDEPIDWSYLGTDGTSSAHIPCHTIALLAFWIGQFPVTNAEWACFLEAGGYEDERWWDTEDGRRWRRGELANEGAKSNNRVWRRRFKGDPTLFEQMEQEGRFPSAEAVERWRGWLALDDGGFEAALEGQWQAKRETEPHFWQDARYNHASQPVLGVCWYEARAYCGWLAAQMGMAVRLPTEVEWEAVAVGKERRRYPWGEDWDRLRANTYETRVKRTSPVGAFADGDTPEGVADLAGNVNEWTTSLFGAGEVDDEVPEYAYPYDAGDGREDVESGPSVRRVVRGGGWIGDQSFARAAYRYNGPPALRGHNDGLRVVVAVPSPIL